MVAKTLWIKKNVPPNKKKHGSANKAFKLMCNYYKNDLDISSNLALSILTVHHYQQCKLRAG